MAERFDDRRELKRASAEPLGEMDNQPGADGPVGAFDRYPIVLSTDDTIAQTREQASWSAATAGQSEMLKLLRAVWDEANPSSPEPEDARLFATRSYIAPRAAALTDGVILGGKLEIRRLLDRGGMGEVYAAWHATFDREVAVKVLPSHLAADDEALARFRKAIRTQARLGAHEHIAATMDAGEENGRLYLVMEFVSGMNLADYVRQEGRFNWRDACDCVRQAALGLRHAHNAGVIHRDIKPSNLMRDSAGRIKILDWGLARSEGVDSSVSSLTSAGVPLGTCDFMAPEQARDARSADARSDLYSLGCTLHFLLSGQPPFGEERSLAAKFAAHATKRPPSLGERGVEAPSAVDALLKRLMAKRPDERFQSAQELLDALAAMPARFEAPARARRSWLALGFVLCAIAALAAAPLVWRTESPSTPRRAAAPVDPPTRSNGSLSGAGNLAKSPALTDMELIFVPRVGDYRIVSLLENQRVRQALPAHAIAPGEAFRIQGHFSRPERWWLLWIDTRGKLDPPFCSEGSRREVGYPRRGTATTINPGDPPGTHALLLIAATQEPKPGADEQLKEALRSVSPSPPVGLHFWHRGDEGATFRGAGRSVETAFSYLRTLSDRLPPGFELTAAVFLPAAQGPDVPDSEPSPVGPER